MRQLVAIIMVRGLTYNDANNDDRVTNYNGNKLLILPEECKLYLVKSLYDCTQIYRHT